MSSAVKLSELNEFISCPVCHGYLIDATTVSECLHTFCKSCIVKHIKNDHNKCPKCNTIIHERRPLDYLIQDRNKQDIVYKLVPQLYISELNKRIAARETTGIDPLTKLVLGRKFLHVVLVLREESPNGETQDKPETSNPTTIYLKCPLTIKVYHIRKLLAVKYQLDRIDKVTILHKGDIVCDYDQVSNLAQSLMFCLQYEISNESDHDESMQIDSEAHGNVDEVKIKGESKANVSSLKR